MFKSHRVELEDPDALPEARLKEHIRIAYALVKAGLPRKRQATLV